MRYIGSPILIVILGMVLIGSQVGVRILTQKLSKIRRNFFRQTCYFVVFPLFFLASSFYSFTPPAPLEIATNIPASVEVQNALVEIESYTRTVDIYLDYNHTMFYLMMGSMFLFSILPALSLAYYYMKRLEAFGEDDGRIL